MKRIFFVLLGCLLFLFLISFKTSPVFAASCGEPGGTSCSGGVLKTCQSNGSWTTGTACLYGCANSTSCNASAPLYCEFDCTSGNAACTPSSTGGNGSHNKYCATGTCGCTVPSCTGGNGHTCPTPTPTAPPTYTCQNTSGQYCDDSCASGDGSGTGTCRPGFRCCKTASSCIGLGDFCTVGGTSCCSGTCRGGTCSNATPTPTPTPTGVPCGTVAGAACCPGSTCSGSNLACYNNLCIDTGLCYGMTKCINSYLYTCPASDCGVSNGVFTCSNSNWQLSDRGVCAFGCAADGTNCNEPAYCVNNHNNCLPQPFTCGGNTINSGTDNSCIDCYSSYEKYLIGGSVPDSEYPTYKSSCSNVCSPVSDTCGGTITPSCSQRYPGNTNLSTAHIDNCGNLGCGPPCAGPTPGGSGIPTCTPDCSGAGDVCGSTWYNDPTGCGRCLGTKACSLPVLSSSWWQVKDGDVTTNNDINSNIASGSLFELNGGGGYPGVPAYGASTNLTVTDVSQTGWLANSPNSSYKLFNSTYFLNAVPTDVTINNLVGTLDQTTLNAGVTDSDGYTWFMYDASSTNLPLGISTDINLGTRKVILLVKGGDIDISGNINLTDGYGFFLAVTSGSISVTPSVTSLEGVYVTDGIFSTGTIGVGSDAELTVRGTIAAFGGMSLQRSLSDNTGPSELFEYAPDQELLFPAKLSNYPSSWLEVAP